MIRTEDTPQPIAQRLLSSSRPPTFPSSSLEALVSTYRRSEPMVSSEEGTFTLYAAMLSEISRMVSQMRDIPEVAPLFQSLQSAERDVVPGEPPLSPIAPLAFQAWAYLDLAHGEGRETFGSLCLQLARAQGVQDERLQILEHLSGSAMRFYQHQGHRRGRVILRDILSEKQFVAHVPSGPFGRSRELWYARLLPALSPDDDPVVLHAPYVVVGPELSQWRDYFQRQALETDLDAHLKFGPEPQYWLRYLVEAYIHHAGSAIFLAGLPDQADTRPHAPEFNLEKFEPYQKTIKTHLNRWRREPSKPAKPDRPIRTSKRG